MENIIDKELLHIFSPMLLVQKIVGLRKFHVKNNVITTINWKHSLYTALVAAVVTAVTIFEMHKVFSEIILFGFNNIFRLLAILFLYYLHMYCDIKNRHSFIKLMLELQDINKRTRPASCKPLKFFFYVSLIVSGYIISFKIFYCIVHFNLLDWWDSGMSFLLVISVLTTIETLYCMIVIWFLGDRLECWNRLLLEVESDSVVYISYFVGLENMGKFLGDQWPGEIVVDTFSSIWAAFMLAVRMFRAQVFYHLVVFFIHTLVTLYAVISTIVLQFVDFQLRVIISINTLWIVSGFSLTLTLCLLCQKFESAMNETMVSCVQLLENKRVGKTIRRFAKNILRTGPERCGRFSVYGLFELDAKLPLGFAGFYVTFCTVVLQLELL